MRRSSILLTTFYLLLALLVPSLSLAANENYFEYAPDPWKSARLTVSTVETPYQLFQVSENITLTSVDLWVDNTGSSGEVAFTLLDNNNTTLATKSITLTHTPAVPGGAKLHIDLDSPVDITKYATYAIEISSNLLGLGLYYSDKITLLEHNQNYTTSYVNGSARLGQEEQNFTFKFALYRPEPISGGGTPPPPPPPADASSTPVSTSITNARVVSVTDTSVELAWTTNVAADSRASIRSQLNPLYIVASGYDSTLELEHTLTITGINGSTFYFADVFSSQGPNEQTLTTYTIGFETAAASTPPVNSTSTPPTPPDNNPPPNNNPPNSNPPNNNPTSSASSSSQNSNSPAGSGQASSSSSSLPPPTIGSGQRSDNTGISWNAPASGEPSDGYRIDIFDADHHLERQFTVPAGMHTKDMAGLLPGTHTAVVYANNGGVFTKVAAASEFKTKKPISPLVWFFMIFGFIVASGAAFIGWRLSKERAINQNLENAILK